MNALNNYLTQFTESTESTPTQSQRQSPPPKTTTPQWNNVKQYILNQTMGANTNDNE